MLHALDENHTKIRPNKGKHALCPYCFGKVKAVCGDINIHHWRHGVTSNCDPWKENETEWHRNWKECFPEDWREVIIKNSEEKHIADLLTENGLVVEFQNSSISNRTIQIRENFYNKMVWVINAEHFKDNFSIRSIVTTKLRNLETSLYSFYSSENDIEESLSDRVKEINESYSELESHESLANHIREEIEDYQNRLEEIDKSVKILILENCYYGTFREFYSTEIRVIKDTKREINENNTKATKVDIKIKDLEQLLDFSISGVGEYKIISFSQISSQHFNKCKVVKANTIRTFFPEILDINSESNFRWYEKQEKEYNLLVDISDSIIKFEKELRKIEYANKELSSDRDLSISRLKGELRDWLEVQICRERTKLQENQNKIDRVEGEIYFLSTELETERARLNEESIEYAEELTKSKKKNEIDIKRKYKGLYSFYWKHRRKSWDFAECPLYLDFGKYIFEIASDNQMRKISHLDFINKIKGYRI